MAEQSLDFGPYQLFPARAVLLRAGLPVRLSSRALAILTALALREGELVTSAELMAAVWPGAVVDDTTLRVHLVALRKALCHGPQALNYIGNVSGRGYRLVVPVARAQPASASGAMALPPTPIARLIGRCQAVAAIVRELPRRRLVTLSAAAASARPASRWPPPSSWRRATGTAPASST
ncbi:winged helix-turn-helix domain-containing protein [Rugamonas sp.]|uniref:winged helix-turn-helix domain-containing protein n=1 Tax=Rugamonas sp. TaxID=1926287 RepID=UPI0025DB84D2|nr:winged helix-turn-helix domain-containing protein [Rugamonas sp.]